jgi:hypothetical protein
MPKPKTTKQQPAAKTKAKAEKSKPLQAALKAVAEAKPDPANDKAKPTKLQQVIALLSRPEGATLQDIMTATAWQKHTVRSAISHTLIKKRGLPIVSDKPNGGERIYKMVETKN